MANKGSSSFDAQALYEALDAQRRARGMSWEALSLTLHVGASTIKRMTSRHDHETDSVLQMVWWLGRSVESFCGEDIPCRAAGDWGSTGQFLRLDTKALHAALDAERTRGGMTWSDLAREISPLVQPSALTGLKKGGRIGLQRVLAMVRWLNKRVADFTYLSPR